MAGKEYFLHHSPGQIPIGEFIRTTGGAEQQVTAGDAAKGYSYAWDAQTGQYASVHNQVSDRMESYLKVGGNKNFFVHLTEADPENVFPDVNVLNTPARAIKGEGAQRVLDSISIPSHLSDEEAMTLVQDMVRKAGVPEIDSASQKAKDLTFSISDKADTALLDYEEVQGQAYIDHQIKRAATEGEKILSGENTLDDFANYLAYDEIKAYALGGGKQGVIERYYKHPKVIEALGREGRSPRRFGQIRVLFSRKKGRT
jgi:hypothetical protein